MQDLFTENHKTLLQDVTKDLNKWNGIPCSWIGRLNIAKMATAYKLIYRFDAIPNIIPDIVFVLLLLFCRINLKFYIEIQGTQNKK